MTRITDSATLAAFCQDVGAVPYLALDTEFNRTKTYWPELCLVQVATPEGYVLIDPLAPNMDLTPLWDLLRREDIVKVFHACRQDVEIIYKLAGFVPSPLFDTQVAACFCGFRDNLGYAALVKALTQKQVEKDQRFTDWAVRPLTEAQCRYAAQDVTHLCTIYEKLTAMLAQQGRTAWLEAELQKLQSPEIYCVDPQQAYKRLKMNALGSKGQAIARGLALWREEQAQAKDYARGRILRDEVLLAIAAAAPKTKEALHKVRGLPGGLKPAVQEAILEACAAGLDAGPPPSKPKAAALDDMQRQQVALLGALQKSISQKEGIAESLLAVQDDLQALVRGDRDGVGCLQGWRGALFGAPAIDLLEGRLALAIQDGSLVCLPLNEAA